MSILKKVETQIFLGLLFVYWALIIWVDNTNITTGNGLYKAVDVHGWETFTKFTVDSGGLLYAISMAAISKLIPDSLVSFYGDVVPGFVTYRKLAFINSLFGAGASVILYNLSFRITLSKMWSLCVAFVHAFSAFILINSIISEDIMPAYFFYLLSFLFVFKGLFDNQKRRLWLTLATFSTLAVMFLHWSLFPIAALTYLVIGVYICRQDQQFVRLIIEQIILFLGTIFLFCFLTNAIGGHLYKSRLHFLDILLPHKASGSWVGFSWMKFESMFTGIGNYLFGGLPMDKIPNILSIIFLRIAMTWLSVIFLFATIWKNKTIILEGPYTRILLIFGVCSFVFGQLVNLYSQPQDPQFQLQPMVLISLGLICLHDLQLKKYINALFIFCGVLAFDNIQRLQNFKGQDSKAVTGYKEFRQLFTKETTKISHIAYESFSAWLMIFEYPGDWNKYLEEITCINTPVHHHPHLTIPEHAQFILKELEAAHKAGKRIIATGPWINRDSMMCLTIIHLKPAQIDELSNILLSKYKVKQTYKLKWGEFAEIVPND